MRRLGFLSAAVALALGTVLLGTGGVAVAKKSSGPVVRSVSPAHGYVSGGTTVAITGKNIVSASVVDFGSTPATLIEPKSANTILAVSPAGTGTVDITVTTSVGTSPITPADEFTYVSTPVIQSVAPRTGASAGGNRVTISGADFTGATAVDFGSTPAASYVVDSDQAITAITPEESVGTVDVTVTGPDGVSPIDPADHFNFVLRVPRVTSVVPDVGPSTGGTSVTIRGSGFTKSSAVDFGSTPAESVTVTNSRSITATSPSGSGTVDVTVTTVKGTSVITPVDEFIYSS